MAEEDLSPARWEIVQVLSDRSRTWGLRINISDPSRPV
jgi:hypothetical protein